MKAKWFAAWLLILTLLLSIVPASAEQPDDNVIREMEFQRAIALGFVPQSCLEKPDEFITYREFSQAVTTLVENYKPDNTAYWQEISQNVSALDEIMARRDAAIGFLYASIALDCCYETLYDIPGTPELTGLFPADWSAAPWPELPADFQMHGKIPGRPEGTDGYHGIQNTMDAAIWYSVLRNSQFTEFTLLEWNKQNNLRIDENCTRREAMLGLIRLLESAPNLVEGNHYISVYDATAYDPAIITPELLATPTDLPDAAQAKLPGNWRGTGISHYKGGVVYQEFAETDIAFLAENGMNFARIFFGPSSLRFPEYPEDMTLINETELRDLDQLIAWGIKYGVHIQISFSLTPSEYDYFDRSETEWEYFRAYWEAITRRYAGIPSRYLSFDLFNELAPLHQDVEYSIQQMRRVIESLRAADPDRILIASFHDNPDMEWVEGIASLGVALSNHPYRPMYICCGDKDVCPEDGEMKWPYPYFPHLMPEGEKLTLSGDISGKKIGFFFGSWVDQPFEIAFDNGETQSIPSLVNGRFSGELWLSVPQGVTEMTFSCAQDLYFKEIGIPEADSWLIPHDLPFSATSSGVADLQWNKEDGWTSEKVVDGEFVYYDRCEPVLKIAQEYGVGYMVNEGGLYSACDGALKASYDEELFRCLQEHGISWCVCELQTFASHVQDTRDLTSTEYETVHYRLDSGARRSISYSAEVMEAYRRLLQE